MRRSFKACRITVDSHFVRNRVLSKQYEVLGSWAFVHVAPDPRTSPSPQRAPSQAGSSPSASPRGRPLPLMHASPPPSALPPIIVPAAPVQAFAVPPAGMALPPAAAPSEAGMHDIDVYFGHAPSAASGAGPSALPEPWVGALVGLVGLEPTPQQLQAQMEELREESRREREEAARRIDDLERTVHQLLERAGPA